MKTAYRRFGGYPWFGGRYAPEAQLATSPTIVKLMNGLVSLVRHGLTSCQGGFGSKVQPRSCGGSWYKNNALLGGPPAVLTNDGGLGFTPTSNDAASVVGELDLLLTGGRLNARSRRIVEERYTAALSSDEAVGRWSGLKGPSAAPPHPAVAPRMSTARRRRARPERAAVTLRVGRRFPQGRRARSSWRSSSWWARRSSTPWER